MKISISVADNYISVDLIIGTTLGPMMDKRSLEGAEDVSLPEKQIHKSNAFVYIL